MNIARPDYERKLAAAKADLCLCPTHAQAVEWLISMVELIGRGEIVVVEEDKVAA